jgi:hypothetical protein
LLECERGVFPAFAKCGWPFDVPFKECLPSQVEPIGDGLNALRADRLPVGEPCPAKLGQMGLQPGLGQPFS